MNSKLIALIVAGFVGIPMAAAATTLEDRTVVTGHTVYANMGGFDEDLALVAGIVESKVVWFGGMTVLNTVAGGFVYAVAADQCDPRDGENYVFQDYDIAFRDPNNVTHIVAHYTYTCEGSFATAVSALDSLLPFNETQHVWITPTHAKTTDPPVVAFDQGRIYNFATGVNTKLLVGGGLTGSARGTTEHSGTGGTSGPEVNDGDSYCSSEDDHVCNGSTGQTEGEDTLHEHNTLEVDLYFSKEDRGTDATYPDGSPFTGTVQECPNDTYCAFVSDPSKDQYEVWAGQ